MLDTNIVSDLVRNPRGTVRTRLGMLPRDAACISVLTAAELHYGVRKKRSPKLQHDIEVIIDAIDIVPFDVPADTEYAAVRDALTRAGTPLGPIDYLIAAHALALDLTLITANVREFSRVPGLRVENWLD